MESTSQLHQESAIDINSVVNQAIHIKINGGSNTKVFNFLVENGVESNEAKSFVTSLSKKIIAEKKSAAGKDILYGLLWCIGGTILTLANIGFIFWGAIVFGGIQFFKGIYNYFES